MPEDFSNELEYASRELTRIQKELLYADTIVLSPNPQQKDFSALIRAYSYVWLAAALERVTTDVLKSTVRELNTLLLTGENTKTCLLTMAYNPYIASIASKHPNPSWEARVELLSKVTTPVGLVFYEDAIPIDGKTLRAEHFDRIWLVFGLRGASLPGPRHRMALKDLADGRNEIAHGDTDPISFGKKKAITDILKLCEKVDDIIINLINATDDLIRNKLYLR